MKIGIIGAMEIEVAEIKELINNVVEEIISGITYYQGTIYDKDVIIARCGVGKVHAAICAQTMILKYSPDVIINTGVAGSLNSNLDIGDLVISDNVIQHDFNTSALGDPIGLISGLNLVEIPSSSHIVKKIKNAAETIKGVNIFIGAIASGDQFICDNKQKDYIVNNFNALCAEMEGAAIGHVCYLNNVDFCVVRSISDKADGSAHMDFPTFVQIAAKNSTILIKNFLRDL